jgi:tetratricopeptide (TPR) repeat protein
MLVLALLTMTGPMLVARAARLRHPELFALPLLVLCIWGFGWMQTVHLNPSSLKWFSPRAAQFHEKWIPAPLLSAAQSSDDTVLRDLAKRRSLSVASERTRAWMLAPLLFAIVMLVSWGLFRNREMVSALLIVIAGCGTCFAALGLVDLVRPAEVATRFLEPESAGAPFASFVNRNNAAGFLNLALGCAVGWTVLQLSRSARSRGLDRRFDFQAETPWQGILLYLERGMTLCNTQVLLGLILSALLLFAIFASFSRGGGIAALAAGVVLVLQTLRTRHGFWGSAIATVIILGMAGGLGLLGLTDVVQTRFASIFGEDGIHDGRLSHWPDGLAAALHYFPWGSGMGTYRFAYLPFQSKSADSWFVNADNLWLEWFVEGGIVMIGATALMVLLTLWMIQRLSRLDLAHALGLRATGWFVVSSLLVSQFFDFGLLLPSTYLTLAILLGAIIGTIEADDRGGIQRTAANRWVNWLIQNSLLDWVRNVRPRIRQVVAVVSVLLLWVLLWQSARHAAQVARMDYLNRGVHLAGKERNREFLKAAVPLVEIAAAATPWDGERWMIAARAKLQLQQIAALDLTTELDRERLWRVGSIETRRAVYFESIAPTGRPAAQALLPSQNLKVLTDAHRHALTALCASPLDPRARELLLRLDFAGPAPEASGELCKVTGNLFPRSPGFLEHLARLAAVYPGFPVAAEMWRQSLMEQPSRLPTVWSLASQLTLPQSPLIEIIPDSAELVVTALETIPLTDLQRAALLQRAKDLMQPVTDAAAPIQQPALRGRLEALTESWDQAARYFEIAVQVNPSDPALRFRYAQSLERIGKTGAAIEQLTRCCLQAPNNAQYAELRTKLQHKRPGVERNQGS